MPADENAPFPVPLEFVKCSADKECMVVSSGCTHPTPINRAHEEELDDWWYESSWPVHGGVKSACGNAPSDSPNGSWNGYPGVCKSGTCQLPPLVR